MANTEVRKVLQLVREAENAVGDALDAGELTEAQRAVLDRTQDKLRELDNLLVLEDLTQSLTKLKKASTTVVALNQKVKKEIAKFKAIVEAVAKVAKGVEALVKAFEILAKAGIA
jgi:hypothetical protein